MTSKTTSIAAASRASRDLTELRVIVVLLLLGSVTIVMALFQTRWITASAGGRGAGEAGPKAGMLEQAWWE